MNTVRLWWADLKTTANRELWEVLFQHFNTYLLLLLPGNTAMCGCLSLYAHPVMNWRLVQGVPL